MTQARQALGIRGEELVCALIARRGYQVLARRYRTRAGEIDIVARHGAFIVFIEVKARTDECFGNPAEAVTTRKQQRLAAMAADYLVRHKLHDVPCRFDVAAVDMAAHPPQVTLFDDAFRPGW